MAILVTGGAGYVGSHTCVELLVAGHDVVVMDNLYNSKEESLRRVEQLTGKNIPFYHVDLLDAAGMNTIFEGHEITAVVHFAGLKAVGESVTKPMDYYLNNVYGTLNLCQVMAAHNVKNIVFSSSATVYGDPHQVPIKETFPLSSTNPYGRTKLIIEKMLEDIQHADQKWNVIMLRYFNPVGAHHSGLLGEDPNGTPNNLLPYVTQVAVGKLKQLTIFGNDYPTRDGTCVRDYIHVVDLARGHVKAVEKLKTKPGLVAYNLGTGKGYSVLEVVNVFMKATGQNINYRLGERRPGDVPTTYADPSKAEEELNWKATKGLFDICEDSWRWQSKNPNGYDV